MKLYQPKGVRKGSYFTKKSRVHDYERAKEYLSSLGEEQGEEEVKGEETAEMFSFALSGENGQKGSSKDLEERKYTFEDDHGVERPPLIDGKLYTRSTSFLSYSTSNPLPGSLRFFSFSR